MLNKKCKCGKILKDNRRTYCSHSCSNKYRKLVFTKERNIKISKSLTGKKMDKPIFFVEDDILARQSVEGEFDEV